MTLRSRDQQKIMDVIADLGPGQATISAIEEKVSFERHTLAKYLAVMESQGLVVHRVVGKAKLWLLNKAPLSTVLGSQRREKTFLETILGELLGGLPLGIVMLDKNLSILYANTWVQQRWGKCEGTLFYSTILGLEYPSSLKQLLALVDRTKDKVTFEIVDPEKRLLRLRGSTSANPDGSHSLVVIIEDVTEEHRMAQEIIEKQALLQSERDALNRMAIVAETDVRGIITFANDRFCEISGYTRNELLGKTHRIVNSDFHATSVFQKMWKTILAGKVWEGILRNKKKDGTVYWVDTTIAPVLGPHGKPVKFLSIRYVIPEPGKAEQKAAKLGRRA